MDSIYFEDPLGLLIELASYRFEPPFGYTHADVLLEAHKLRVERGDYNIAQVHLADAIEPLVAPLARARCRRTARRRTPTRARRHRLSMRRGSDGRQHAQHPQAERQQPDRAHLRPRRRPRLRGGRRVGQDGHARVPGEGPGRPDAAARGGRAAAADRCGRAARSCSTSATSTASTSSTRPIRPSGRWSTARCST